MTRDDIVRMAREAGGHASGFGDRWVVYTPDLERFAALVAAAEREACAALCEARFTGDLSRVANQDEKIHSGGRRCGR